MMAPKILQLETTARCNASCGFCPGSTGTVGRAPLMAEVVWRKIADETRGLGLIYRPFGLGEPLLHPDIAEIVWTLKRDSTARVELHSNAALLDQRMTHALIRARLDVMRLSIDGATPEAVAGARGLDGAEVYRNACAWVDLSRGLVTTEVRMIGDLGDGAERERYREFWESRGALVVFTDLYRYPWCGQTDSVERPCRKIGQEMFVLSDGRVTLCCWDTYGSQIVGDIREQHVLEAWNSEPMTHARELLKAGRRRDLHVCSRCDAYAKEAV